MAQRTSHLYHLITLPKFYGKLQNALGAVNARRTFVANVVQPVAGMKVLDVGCGPATLFGYLGDVEYTGLDLNPKHIKHAEEIYAGRGRFICGNAATDLEGLEDNFDIAIISGLLHHLSDADAKSLMRRLGQLVRPGGRVCTIDPVWSRRQHVVARLLKALDSGKNIRGPDGYLALVGGLPFAVTQHEYENLLRAPYNHFCMSLRRV